MTSLKEQVTYNTINPESYFREKYRSENDSSNVTSFMGGKYNIPNDPHPAFNYGLHLSVMSNRPYHFQENAGEVSRMFFDLDGQHDFWSENMKKELSQAIVSVFKETFENVTEVVIDVIVNDKYPKRKLHLFAFDKVKTSEGRDEVVHFVVSKDTRKYLYSKVIEVYPPIKDYLDVGVNGLRVIGANKVKDKLDSDGVKEYKKDENGDVLKSKSGAWIVLKVSDHDKGVYLPPSYLGITKERTELGLRVLREEEKYPRNLCPEAYLRYSILIGATEKETRIREGVVIPCSKKKNVRAVKTYNSEEEQLIEEVLQKFLKKERQSEAFSVNFSKKGDGGLRVVLNREKTSWCMTDGERDHEKRPCYVSLSEDGVVFVKCSCTHRWLRCGKI